MLTQVRGELVNEATHPAFASLSMNSATHPTPALTNEKKTNKKKPFFPVPTREHTMRKGTFQHWPPGLVKLGVCGPGDCCGLLNHKTAFAEHEPQQQGALNFTIGL